MYSCDGYSITTVEGLGNKSTGLHSIQKRLAEKNGSQCGYCSPGFVMTMYTKLKNNPKPSKQEIEQSLDGNICRCTGYRAILDSMNSFAIDENPIDIEELCALKCINSQTCSKTLSNKPEMHSVCKNSKTWYSPENLDHLKVILELNQNLKFRFVCGNTSSGIYKNQDPVDSYINLKAVKELYEIQKKNLF